MTANQIMHEIESLPLEEQARVIRFAYRLEAELSALAARMVQSTDPAEAMQLREEIERGFYGGKPHA